MKLFKKALSVAAALALVVTAVPANARAAADVVDFEDGNIPASISMKVDDGGDLSVLSVVDYNGSKALLVDIQDGALVSKVIIDVMALVGASNLDLVRAIQMDVSVKNADGNPLNWNGGGIGATIGADGSVWYQGQASWEVNDAENSEGTVSFKESFVDGMGFTKDATASTYLFMNWSGTGNDMYIDNIQFLGADGNPLPLTLATADAAATDTAATTDVPKTGVVGLGIVYGLGALATGAVALKRKQR